MTGAKKSEPQCPICQHPDREGIEMLGVLAAANFRIAAKRINNTFGTSFSADTVRNHMKNHALHRTATEAGVILDAVTDDDKPVITVKNMAHTILMQGMLDLSKGNLRCKTVSELISVMRMCLEIQDREAAQVGGMSVDGFYAAMSAYGEAIRDTVSPAQLDAIVTKAGALGAAFNIGNMRLAKPAEDVRQVLVQAIQDKRRLGRGRTREELIEAGVIEVDGVELPEIE